MAGSKDPAVFVLGGCVSCGRRPCAGQVTRHTHRWLWDFLVTARQRGSKEIRLPHQINSFDGVRGQSEEFLANSFSIRDHSMPGWVQQYCAMVIISAPRRLVGIDLLLKPRQQFEFLSIQMSTVSRESELISIRIRATKLNIGPVRAFGWRAEPSLPLVLYVRNLIDGTEPPASQVRPFLSRVIRQFGLSAIFAAALGLASLIDTCVRLSDQEKQLV